MQQLFNKIANAGILSLGLLGGTLLSGLSIVNPAWSAEEIAIRYSAAERTISVADLETYVDTGEIPESLQWYADRLTEEQQATLRAVLQKRFDVPLDEVTTFVERSPSGESILRRLLGLFWGGPNDEALLDALRGSLLLAATDDDGLTLMNVIRQYPLSNMRIDLEVGLEAAAQLKQIVIDDRQIFDAIEQKGAGGITATTSDQLPANFFEPRDAGPWSWEKREISYSNPARGSELIPADVYLPEGLSEPAPLIVFSHGFASSRTAFAYLAEHLASHGFAVVAIEHPGTDSIALQNYIELRADVSGADSFIQRPLDIAAALDHLEQKTADDPDWQGRFLTEDVGIFGHSLGGYTVLAAGGARLDFDYLEQGCQAEQQQVLPFNLSRVLECNMQRVSDPVSDLSDDRIAAVFALSPTTSLLFGPEGMGQIEVPVMMVAGTRDFAAPAVPEQITPFTWLTAEDKYLVLVEPGTHFSFLAGGGGDEDVFKLPEVLLGPDPKFGHPAMQWMTTTFFSTHIKETSEFESFLQELMLPSGTGEFNFALTRSFTQEDIDAALSAGE